VDRQVDGLSEDLNVLMQPGHEASEPRFSRPHECQGAPTFCVTGWVMHRPKAPEVTPQEFTRQLDLAFVSDLADEFRDGSIVADFVRFVKREFATYTDGDTRDAVRLSTYHLAKGLEWEAVFLPRLNDGELPHWRSKAEDEIAEERRLF